LRLIHLAAGHVTTQAVSCRVLNAEAWVRSWAGPCDVCGCQIGTGGRVFSQYFGVALSVSFHHYSVLIFIYRLLLLEDKRTKPGNLPKSSAVLEIGDHWIEEYFHFSFFKELKYCPGMGLDGLKRSKS
jgi:hypothetical protein